MASFIAEGSALPPSPSPDLEWQHFFFFSVLLRGLELVPKAVKLEEQREIQLPL